MSGRRLLLVDDDDDIRTIATISLERVGGWTVVAVASGRLAVEAAGADPFDAVLLDVMMPDMDGPATLEQLRSGPLGPDVPVVFLTAKLQPADRAYLSSLGAAGVLPKPFDPMGLPRDLDRLIGAA